MTDEPVGREMIERLEQQRAAREAARKDPARRILVLGQSGFASRVRSYEWADVPADLNIADYDSVVIDLVPLQFDDDLRDEAFQRAVPNAREIGNLLFSKGSELITIDLLHPDRPSKQFGPWYSPVWLFWDGDQGEAIHSVSSEFSWYFGHVERYFSCFTGTYSPRDPEAESFAQANDHTANSAGLAMRSLAKTRFGKPIAVEAQLASVRTDDFGRKEPLRETDGTWIILPPLTDGTHPQAVELILRERYGVAVKASAPSWVGAFVLPRQAEADTRLDQARADQKAAAVRVAEAEHARAEAGRFARLLYEREEALEPIVLDALAELGASVEQPKRPGREDGRLTDPSGRHAILEIKSHSSGPVKLRDVRQLHQWDADAIADEDWIGKPILIVNAHASTPVGQRSAAIEGQTLRTVERFGCAVLTTSQLYQALHDDQQGALNRSEFWDAVLSADGVIDLPEPEPIQLPTENGATGDALPTADSGAESA
jgi:hypothetical protein